MITQQELVTSNVCVMTRDFIGIRHKVLQFLFSKCDDESIQVCIIYIFFSHNVMVIIVQCYIIIILDNLLQY